MPVILHLTDLHLATPDDHAGADFKNDIVPIAHRPDRLSALESTLRAVGESDWDLDALVITGDIPFKNAAEGWGQFDAALKPLRDAGKLPDPDRIIVTPGNHDVAWGLPIDDEAHYAEFIEHVRKPGYTTPPLDGIDLNEDGQVTSGLEHFLLDVDAGFAIVPINSSHYCGALEPMGKKLTDDEWKQALAKLDGVDSTLAKKVEQQMRAFRSQDIARISEPQFKALIAVTTSMREAVAAAGANPDELVWIAAVHHHLLPVNTDEEFKSYESMTNLGRFRQILVDRGFQVLMHGHKHSGGVYWDRVHLQGNSPEASDPRLLIVSGSTAGSRREGTQEIGRLVEVLPSSNQRAVLVSKVPVIDHGGRLPDRLNQERAELWRSEMMMDPVLPRVVSGSDANQVYARVLALFAGLSAGNAVSDLVCEVRDARPMDEPPDGYPTDRLPGGESAAQEWFKETVRWWQKDGSKFHFTHGERLRAWGPTGIDQVTRAVSLLQNESSSSRAVMTLFNPSTDDVPNEKSRFPAFSFAHLIIRETAGEARRLDCIGFFRKQEMRFWWPINVAELALLQSTVHKRLEQPGLQLGSVITYASLAHLGTEVPDVNITAIDRLADDYEDRLWDMAYGVVHPESVDARMVKEAWLQVLTDLEPPDAEQVPRPRLGIEMLRRFIARFGPHDPGSPARSIEESLETLENAYEAIAKEAGSLDHWRKEIVEALGEIRQRTEEVLSV